MPQMPVSGTLVCSPNLQDRADRVDRAAVFAVLRHLQEGRIDGLRGERIGVHGLPGVGPLRVMGNRNIHWPGRRMELLKAHYRYY